MIIKILSGFTLVAGLLIMCIDDSSGYKPILLGIFICAISIGALYMYRKGV